MNEDAARPMRYELRQARDKSWLVYDLIEDRTAERNGLVFVGLDLTEAEDCQKLLEATRRE